MGSNDDSTWLAREVGFFEFNFLNVSARNYYQAYIAAVPIDRRRRVPRLFYGFAYDFCRWRAVLIGKGEDDIAVLWGSAHSRDDRAPRAERLVSYRTLRIFEM